LDQPKDPTAQTLAIFWLHAFVYWPMLLLCLGGILTGIAADLTWPLLYKRLFDLLAIDPIHKMNRGTLQEIYHVIALTAVVSLISVTAWRASQFGVVRFESRAMKDLTDHCFEYLQHHSNRFFTDNFAGALLKRVNRFALSFEVLADQCVGEVGPAMVRAVFLIAILFWNNVTIGWIFFAWTATFVSFSFFFATRRLKFDKIRVELDTKVTGRLADTISNNINLKLFDGIEREISQFEDLTDEHRAARYHSWKMGWWADVFQGSSVRVLEIVVLVVAVRYWIKGILTLGDFILLRLYLVQLSEQVRQVGLAVRRIYEATADANEMTEILLTPHEVVDEANATLLTVPQGVIEFRSLQFAYRKDAKLVLRDFNLKTKPGERVGIVGPSGGGKSTVLKLLTRLYDVNNGAILIDHQDIAGVTQSSLHQNIAYVPQDPILFHRSLMENIRYSRSGATDEEVVRAAQLAHCHEFISGFPEGYQTLVGERGVKLSGGERQRVAIARAILMDAPILVLDEATSSLDSESEMFIQDSLSRLMVGRTVIAVAHRLSTIRKMDRIVVVIGGHIAEEGSHDLLVKIEHGTYRRLWDLQSTDLLPDSFEKGGSIQ
jgi:ATP-binding cassette subfamily B protein